MVLAMPLMQLHKRKLWHKEYDNQTQAWLDQHACSKVNQTQLPCQPRQCLTGTCAL
jgi:hypothetical protein